jgi:hypothetical protein
MNNLKQTYLVLILLSCSLGAAGPIMAESKSETTGKPKHVNRLQHEKSPYLLQHKNNPVDWYPWGDEAFEQAKKEDKPIFLSIGYSTCHWCHVMEHESFEDEEVAALMNEHFINIKVDREERPDIDNIYMTAAQVIFRKRGGWPLTILMTADKDPFFAGTYFPKQDMMKLVPQVGEAWKEKRSEIMQSAEAANGFMQEVAKTLPGDQLDPNALDAAYSNLSSSFDKTYGGFGSSPKFPTPHNFLFLLRHWKRNGQKESLEMVEKTLQEMRKGGMYDHVGFGFHRYSTDHKWFLPHFEKMLYDQALLAMAYTETYQATGKTEYADTAREIFTYVLRDMIDKDGGFFSAEDADSEGEEGKFYLWKQDEVLEILGKEAGALYADVLNVSKTGNYHEEATGHKTDTNIPHLQKSLAEWAKDLNTTEGELKKNLEASRQKLFDVREKRIHPYKDDKILVDWNGLMIAALAKAARTLNEPKYTAAAQNAVGFILKTMRHENGRLKHRYREGDAGLQASVDDYAFLIWGLLELYETDFNLAHLQTALEMQAILDKNFWDAKSGGYYFSPDDGEKLLVRQKEIYDGAVPSGNSVSMWNLLRLSRITGNTEFQTKAITLGKAFSVQVASRPASYTLLMCGLDFATGPSFEIVIAGSGKSDDTQSMLSAVRKQYLPNKVVLLQDPKTARALAKLAEYTQYQKPIDDKATAYVCQNFTCAAPTTDIKKMLTLLLEK